MQDNFAVRPENILPHDGEVLYFPSVLSAIDAETLFHQLRTTVAWEQNSVRIFGKWIPEPRLTAYFGDADMSYTYSGRRLAPLQWTDALIAVKNIAELLAGATFNAVLLNYYRNGRDSMGWHRDNERELGKEPVIASISLGATRKFCLRHYYDKKLKLSLSLEPGSVLIMRGATQHCWEHALPKQSHVDERINLTFRQINVSG